MALVLAGARGEDFSLSAGSGVELNVLGQSGKFTLSGFSENDTDTIKVSMDYIKEVDAFGDVVGKHGGGGKGGGPAVHTFHALESFAPTQFAFSELYTARVPGIHGPDGTADVNASAVDFFVKLVDDTATLTVQALLFAENGTIAPTNGDEKFTVTEGSLKFNVIVSALHDTAVQLGTRRFYQY